MKKIINGKVYDTDTARSVGMCENGRSVNDFEWCAEFLYQKRTGEFFLNGIGNCNSKYAESTGNNSWTSGWKIIPLTYEAAREWAEEHLTADDYEAIFGAVVEDDTRKLVTLSMSVTAIEKAKRATLQAGMSLSAYIESLIQ